MFPTLLSIILAALAFGAAVPKAGEVANAPYVTMLKASPGALFAGSGTNLTCTITPHVDNRKIEIGVSGSWREDKQLDQWSRKTFKLQVPVVLCGGVAYCSVTRVTGRSEMVEVPLQLQGCESGE